MRMRKKKHGPERMAACSELFYEPAEGCFKNPDNKTYIEIGCGKGKFICTLAEVNPDINFIAIEKISDVILLAMERAKEAGLENLKFLNCDASVLAETLPEGCADRLYLNFNDPWPKKGHYKRRLTYKTFLDIYKKILKPGGEIFFKTDNIDYFNFSLEQFKENGFALYEVTNDLHASEFEKDNIHTEYEDIFSERGFKINRCVAKIIN